MEQLYHTVRQIFSGMRTISSNAKYVAICFGVALVHLHFTVAFAICGIMSLCWYNVFITLFYLYHCFVSLKKKQYGFIYISSVVEILFHSCVASILLGWDWGFMFYTIALVPVSFYLSYTMKNRLRNIGMPILTSTIVTVCYMVMLAISRKVPPVLMQCSNGKEASYFYYFNTMVAFVMLFLFSILFSLEIRYMQKQLEQENSELEEIARFDPLTHLLNRRSMHDELHRAMNAADKGQENFCLIMADIDDFKKINDTYGHDCGDEVLVAIANIISGNVRENDAVCRWGGEEMLILIRTDEEMAVRVAERIRREIAARRGWYKDNKFIVTVTLGVTAYEEGTNIRTMIGQADQNLYKGKNNGKNQVVH